MKVALPAISVGASLIIGVSKFFEKYNMHKNDEYLSDIGPYPAISVIETFLRWHSQRAPSRIAFIVSYNYFLFFICIYDLRMQISY